MSSKWTNITGFDPEHKKDIIQIRGKFRWVYVLKCSIGSVLTFLFWQLCCHYVGDYPCFLRYTNQYNLTCKWLRNNGIYEYVRRVYGCICNTERMLRRMWKSINNQRIWMTEICTILQLFWIFCIILK